MATMSPRRALGLAAVAASAMMLAGCNQSLIGTHSPATEATPIQAAEPVASSNRVPLTSAFNMAFTASISPSSSSNVSSSPPPRIQPGGTYQGADLIELLRARGSDGTSSSQPMFERSTLSLVFRDRGTGEVRRTALAECQSIDFVSEEPTTVSQQTICDGARFAYGVGDRGLEVTRNGKVVMSVPLERGTYALNGVRFTI